MHSKLTSLLCGVAMLLIGTSCDATSRLNPQDIPALGQIEITAATSRSHQIFRQNLQRLLARTPQTQPRYRLDANITQTQSETSTRLILNYQFYDQQTGKSLITDRINLSASFGAVSSLFGQDIAANQAQTRLAVQLSEQIYLKLLAYFTASQPPQGETPQGEAS